MNRIGSVIGLVCVVVVSALSSRSLAQNQMNAYSHAIVNPDFNSGTVSSNANGSNAIVDTISSGMSFRIEPVLGQAFVMTNVYMSGSWGSASTNSPYYNFLQNHGLNTNSSFSETNVLWNGQWYEFNDVVSVSQYAHAGIDRDVEHTWLQGFSYGSVSGIGAIPVNSSSWYRMYEPGHPSWLPDWEVSFNSEWLVTTGFHSTPAPGSLALIGLGGLVAMRRRR